jgi:hypothetical protein
MVISFKNQCYDGGSELMAEICIIQNRYFCDTHIDHPDVVNLGDVGRAGVEELVEAEQQVDDEEGEQDDPEDEGDLGSILLINFGRNLRTQENQSQQVYKYV